MVATAEWVHWYGHHPASVRHRHAYPRRVRGRLDPRHQPRPPPPGITTTSHHKTRGLTLPPVPIQGRGPVLALTDPLLHGPPHVGPGSSSSEYFAAGMVSILSTQGKKNSPSPRNTTHSRLCRPPEVRHTPSRPYQHIPAIPALRPPAPPSGEKTSMHIFNDFQISTNIIST